MIQHILSPVDFSDASRNALSYAATIAAKCGASLTLLFSTSESSVDFHHEAIEDGSTAADLLTEWADEIKSSHPDLAVHSKVTSGRLVNAILNEISNGPVDLVVMGTTGAGGLKQLLVGTHTVEVIDSISVPVLAVPASATFHGLKQIIYSSDYHPVADHSALIPMTDIAKKFSSEITVVNIRFEQREATHSEKIERDKESEAIGPEIPHHFKTVFSEDFEHGLNYYLNDVKKDAEMLAVLAQKHGFMERLLSISHTDRLAYHSKLPVLVLREK